MSEEATARKIVAEAERLARLPDLTEYVSDLLAERDEALERVRVLTDENAKMHADLTRFYEFENAEYRAMRHDDESVRLFSPAEVAAERARAIEETFRDVFEMLDCEDFDLGQMKVINHLPNPKKHRILETGWWSRPSRVRRR